MQFNIVIWTLNKTPINNDRIASVRLALEAFKAGPRFVTDGLGQFKIPSMHHTQRVFLPSIYVFIFLKKSILTTLSLDRLDGRLSSI